MTTQGTVPCVELGNIKNTQNRPLCYSSRSLSVNRSDLGLDGLRMPVNIDFIYTPAIDSYYKYLEKEASIIAGQEVEHRGRFCVLTK